MNKCDFCVYSKMNNSTGRLVCPYSTCILAQHQIDKLLEKMVGGGNRRK